MAQGEHLYDCYAPPAQEFVRGEGVYLYTQPGEKYLDFISGIAVNSLGHCHPELVRVLKLQADKLWHLSNMFRIPGQRELAQKYCAALPFAEKVFFTNSGAEAIECALKTARKYHAHKGAPERYEIISFTGAFHGRTFATINAAGNPKYLEGFGPALPGFIHVNFGDHDALEAALSERTAAILVEPVQGEGGVRALSEPCLRGLRELCDARDIVLIYDEVQCGAGRTGKLFAHQWVEGGEPDILAAAKGIGGGFPLGACMARAQIAEAMVVGTHGSTYGGNPMAMAVGNAVFDVLMGEGFLEHVCDCANQFKQQLAGLQDEFPDVVADVRGKGLLLGMQLKKPAIEVRKLILAQYLLVGSAGDNVLRMAPPLIIEKPHIREAVEALRCGFEQARKLDDVT